MDASNRPLSLLASLAGTLGQLAVIAAAAPTIRQCIWSACLYGPRGPIELFIGWEPYIDNPGLGLRPSQERRCPGEQAAGSRFRLDHAPLPTSFDVHGYPDGEVLACVRLGRDGAVESVRIVAGTGKARLDSQLLRVIHRQWRFRPIDSAGTGDSWQRVRLNSSYGSDPPTETRSLPL